MLRQIHDASTTFAPRNEAVWHETFLRALDGGRRVITHGDLGPWNIVVRDDQPVAFIDWDDAGPAGHLWDLGNVVWLNAQLHDDDVAARQGLAPVAERTRRARVILDGYRLPTQERSTLVDVMVELAVRSARDEAILYGVTEATTSPAEDGFPILWALTWRIRAATWMLDHATEIRRALQHASD